MLALNNLDYVGNTPDRNIAEGPLLYPTQVIVKSNWNMKEETLIYLKKDIIILQKILTELASYIGNKVGINITKHLTIASLASAKHSLLRGITLYNLKIITKNLEKRIKESYSAKHSEVYKHYGKDLYGGSEAPAHSQYPFAMLKDMPVGNPTYTNTISKNLGLFWVRTIRS